MAVNASLVSPPGSGLLLPNLQVRRSYFLTRGCGFVRLRRADVAGSYVWQIRLGGSCASGLGTAAVSFIVQDGPFLIRRKPYNAEAAPFQYPICLGSTAATAGMGRKADISSRR
jgi:hypothetical protein